MFEYKIVQFLLIAGFKVSSIDLYKYYLAHSKEFQQRIKKYYLDEDDSFQEFSEYVNELKQMPESSYEDDNRRLAEIVKDSIFEIRDCAYVLNGEETILKSYQISDDLDDAFSFVVGIVCAEMHDLKMEKFVDLKQQINKAEETIARYDLMNGLEWTILKNESSMKMSFREKICMPF